jgi:hypothetical protein
MKKQSLSTLVKKSIFRIGLASALLIGISSAASAQESTQAKSPVITYIGTLDGQPVFRVQLDNQNSGVRFLTIKDEHGDILYSERIRTGQFSKKFKFESSELGSSKLTFVLEGDKNVQSQVFNVNTNTKVLNDVVVTKL